MEPNINLQQNPAAPMTGVYNGTVEKTTDHPFSIPTIVSLALQEINDAGNAGVNLNNINDEVLANLLHYNLVKITSMGTVITTTKGKQALSNKIVVVYPFDSGVDANGEARTVTVNNYNLSLLSMSSSAAAAFIKALSATANTFFNKIGSSNLITNFVHSLQVSGVFGRILDKTLSLRVRDELEEKIYRDIVENPDITFLHSETNKLHNVCATAMIAQLAKLSLNNQLSLPKISLFGNSHIYTKSIKYDEIMKILYVDYVNEEGEEKQIEYELLDLNQKITLLDLVSNQ